MVDYVIVEIDGNNDCIWLAVNPAAGALTIPSKNDSPSAPPPGIDFSIFRSWRRDGNVIFVANHSISDHPLIPTKPTHNRGVVGPSGFILRKIEGIGCEVTYVLTVPSSDTVRIVIGELVGRSRIAVERMRELGNLLCNGDIVPSSEIPQNLLMTKQSTSSAENGDASGNTPRKGPSACIIS